MFFLDLENAENPQKFFITNKLTIGRSLTCDIVLPFQYISRLHCTVYLESDPLRCCIVDGELFGNHSSFGTYVNGQRVFRYELKNGDEITFCRNNFQPKLRFFDLSPIETEVSTGDT
jgi:pSer/pThr/pTyr-binding forkhead associated (FHA) protein